jgi:uncharacterized phage infection (PIP) family protein YhgE
MGWLSFILQALAPIAVEHGGQALRNSFKARAQSKTLAAPDPLQQLTGNVDQLAADVDQLKGYAAQLKSDLDVLNQAVAAREEKLRKWLLALLVWNIAMTIGLIALAVFFRR